MRTVSRCRPNVRAVSRMLIPSTITARRTRRYTSTLYIRRTIHGVGYNPMDDGGRYSIKSPILSNLPPTRPTLTPPFTRLDAALYAPAPPRQPGQNGRPPLKGARRPPLKALLEPVNVAWASAVVAWYDGTTRAVELTSQTAVWYRSGKPPVLIRWVLIRDPQGVFAPQALLCTDPSADPTQILEWFVLRWQLEATFQEARAHLGVETQRQWSDLAIARTTPILMGLFSWTTLAAQLLRQQRPSAHRTAAWYAKPSPTFVDAIALVRRHLWLASEGFHCPPPTLIYGKSRPLCTTDS